MDPKVAKGWSIGIISFLLVLIIIYTILIFYWYNTQTVMFAGYTPVTPAFPHIRPLGGVTPMTQEDIDHRNEIICNSSPGLSVCKDIKKT